MTVHTHSSIPLSTTLDAQNDKPVCKMRSGEISGNTHASHVGPQSSALDLTHAPLMGIRHAAKDTRLAAQLSLRKVRSSGGAKPD
jgi:hypothetical protein